MDDSPWKRDEVPSPCVNICLLHPEAQICAGCYRTLDEITRWASMDQAERDSITAALPGRAGRLRKRRGGRDARRRG